MNDHPNAALVKRFYEAFARRDAAGMRACYAPDVHFSDPAFPNLNGDEAGDMWAMLCDIATDLKITLAAHDAGDETGTARWIADYSFGPGKRPVHNVIDAKFRFRDGRIVEHLDSFPFWKWSRMALGPAGTLLGWTPLLRIAVQKTTAKQLAKYRKRKAH